MNIIIIKILRIQNLISRLKDIYIKESRGKKTKAYDSYSHFFRWATDRLGKQGIICFITNSLFLDGSFLDRFRKVISKKFFHAYFLDQGDDIRAISGIDGIFIREKQNDLFENDYKSREKGTMSVDGVDGLSYSRVPNKSAARNKSAQWKILIDQIKVPSFFLYFFVFSESA